MGRGIRSKSDWPNCGSASTAEGRVVDYCLAQVFPNDATPMAERDPIGTTLRDSVAESKSFFLFFLVAGERGEWEYERIAFRGSNVCFIGNRERWLSRRRGASLCVCLVVLMF